MKVKLERCREKIERRKFTKEADAIEWRWLTFGRVAEEGLDAGADFASSLVIVAIVQLKFKSFIRFRKLHIENQLAH